MPTLERPSLYTDYYELTMAQGYFLSGRQDETATFDYFFRECPFNSGYVVFAGISDLLELIESIDFNDEELAYLESQGFHPEFLEYLADFRFTGTIHSVSEGEIVFPNEPIARIRGSLIETQLIETILLNILNFESLIATKASRMRNVAGDRLILDFGLRRSQGLGGIHASKAAIIGGFNKTSNVYAAFRFGLEASGTMAHSWIQSFGDELTAFRKYAEFYPDNCILLVDTYDTLKSGVPNAIQVAKELEERGKQLVGIRLDSGDLAYFARKARQQLDDADLSYVKIAVSNQLDEHLIKSLIDQGAPIDVFGVGTRLVTGYDTPALDGVYKLSEVNDEPKLKISENIEKITLPGRKQVYRMIDENNMFYGDGVVLDEEAKTDTIFHPHIPRKKARVADYTQQQLLKPVMVNGKAKDVPNVQNVATYVRERLAQLPAEYKRFDNPHIYKVGISKKLMNLKETLITKAEQNNH